MQVANLWRHPIKGLSREEVMQTHAEVGKSMQGDRVWALAHEHADLDPKNPRWARCSLFARAARGHSLMAVASQTDEKTGQITLTHPALETICVNPDLPADQEILVNWARQISDPKRSLPACVIKAPGRAMTDSSKQSFSIHTFASLNDLQQNLGADLDQRRFRGNLWIEGATPWAEFNWIDKEIRIGEAIFAITKPIERCMATTVNPETGQSDRATLKVLKAVYGHQNFGVQGEVIRAGKIAIGDPVEIM